MPDSDCPLLGFCSGSALTIRIDETEQLDSGLDSCWAISISELLEGLIGCKRGWRSDKWWRAMWGDRWEETGASGMRRCYERWKIDGKLKRCR